MLSEMSAETNNEQRRRKSPISPRGAAVTDTPQINPLEKIEQLLTCSICLDRFKTPKLLPCQHTYCLPCLDNYVDTIHHNLKCPECRAEHSIPLDGAKAFPTNLTLTNFLDIHLEATDDTAEQIDAYINRYNMERCKICDEKAELEMCRHCEKKACKECRKSHMEMLKRDLGRLLNQIRRLSNRLKEATEGVGKGVGQLKSNAENTKAEIREYFQRYSNELKRREEHFIEEVDQFERNEGRILGTLRDSLDAECANLTDSCAWVDSALSGQLDVRDEELCRYKTVFVDGIEYLRSFQPDLEEMFSKKLRFSPGDDAAKLPIAICNFGELTVSYPQFAGRYLPIEQQYLPRPLRMGLESDSFRTSARDEALRTTKFRRAADDEPYRSRHRSRRAADDDDDIGNSSSYRLRVQNGGSGQSSPLSTSPSPFARSPFLAAAASATSHSSPTADRRSIPTLSTDIGDSARPLPNKSPNIEMETAPIARRSRSTAIADTSELTAPSLYAAAAAVEVEGSRRVLRRRSPTTAELYSRFAPPPRQTSGDGDAELSAIFGADGEVADWRRRLREERLRRHTVVIESPTAVRPPPPTVAAAAVVVAAAKTTAPPPPPPQTSRDESPPVQRRHKFKIISRSTSTAPPLSKRRSLEIAASPLSSGSEAVAAAATTRRGNNDSPSSTSSSSEGVAIPIAHFPGDSRRWPATPPSAVAAAADGSADRSPSETPPLTPTSRAAFRDSRRQRFLRSRTNPDIFGSAEQPADDSPPATPSQPTAVLSTRVQQLLNDLQLRNAAEPAVAATALPPPLRPTRQNSGRGDSRRSSLIADPDLPTSSQRSRSRLSPTIGSLIDYGSKAKPKVVFGRRGDAPAEMNWPRGVAALPGGELAVCDSSNHRIQIFHESGKLLRQFGGYGSAVGQLDSCVGVAYARQRQQLVVTDRYNHRVQIFDLDGKYIRSFGKLGKANGEFNNPWGVAVDDLGCVFVVDKDNHRVQIFDQNGQFMGKFGSKGDGIGQFNHPLYIAIHRRTQNLFVTDSANHRVSVHDHDGVPILTFGVEGFHTGQMKLPRGIAVDDQGFVIVADSGNNRIQIFSADGKFAHGFGTWGASSGQLKGAEGVALVDGQIAVADRENHRVQIF